LTVRSFPRPHGDRCNGALEHYTYSGRNGAHDDVERALTFAPVASLLRAVAGVPPGHGEPVVNWLDPKW